MSDKVLTSEEVLDVIQILESVPLYKWSTGFKNDFKLLYHYNDNVHIQWTISDNIYKDMFIYFNELKMQAINFKELEDLFESIWNNVLDKKLVLNYLLFY